MSDAVDVDLSHESQPIIVSSLESKVGKFLDNSPLRSLMNVNGNDDEGHKTKRRSLKSKTTETVKRKRRRLIHEFLSQSDTSDKILTQNEVTEIRENGGILSDKINNVELVSTISNGNGAGTSNSPIVINGSNDSSVFIVENGLIDDVIVISDSQSPNSSMISPNLCTTIEENVTSLDESVRSQLSDGHDRNFDSSPEKSDRIRSSTDVSTNRSSPHSKRKSDLTTETTNTSPSSVSHSRSFRIVRLACNDDDDDVSWRYSREQNSRSSATNSTGSNPVNGSATPPPALMNDRTMKMLMVRSESSNSSATKLFKSHNNISVEKKVKHSRQYVIKECTSPGILKNSNRNAAAPSPKTSKMVNFAENLTHTKFYRIGDALYDECNLDEENDDELGMTTVLPDVLYPSLRNCKDSIDSIMDELNMNAVTVELFRRMGIDNVGDLASIRMTTENGIPETDYNLDKLREALKKYDDERRPTGLRTRQCKTPTCSRTIAELLEEIREAQNLDQSSATDKTAECARTSEPNIRDEKLDFENPSIICTRADESSTKDEEASSSTEQIFDESSVLTVDEVGTVTTNCVTAESSSLPEKNVITNEQVTIDSVEPQQPPVGVENEESDFVCTNDEHNIDPCTFAKLSEVSRSVPSLPNDELNDVTICSPEIITSCEIEHRQDVEDNQSQTLDLEDSNSKEYGRSEVDARRQINVVVWKQAASLAARQFAIEQSTVHEKTADTQVDDALVDSFVEMTTDLLKVFISSECLNVLDRRRLADVCHLVSDLLGEESN